MFWIVQLFLVNQKNKCSEVYSKFWLIEYVFWTVKLFLVDQKFMFWGVKLILVDRKSVLNCTTSFDWSKECLDFVFAVPRNKLLWYFYSLMQWVAVIWNVFFLQSEIFSWDRYSRWNIWQRRTQGDLAKSCADGLTRSNCISAILSFRVQYFANVLIIHKILKVIHLFP